MLGGCYTKSYMCSSLSVLKGDVTKTYDACAQSSLSCRQAHHVAIICVVWKNGLSGGAVQTRRHADHTYVYNSQQGNVAMIRPLTKYLHSQSKICLNVPKYKLRKKVDLMLGET